MPAVSGETSDGNADVVVDLEDAASGDRDNPSLPRLLSSPVPSLSQVHAESPISANPPVLLEKTYKSRFKKQLPIAIVPRKKRRKLEEGRESRENQDQASMEEEGRRK
ncbi:hypothetical protein L2E82_17252 [Cichorium intybus]|uniref:Uncharacterized protein n=1 Tax=Cichorium intybus TaxID=13427 RepID=A0ACB9F8E8_CICIN|nr:hypothetical protein L2E82_17252 [Cichorium intybus]